MGEGNDLDDLFYHQISRAVTRYSDVRNRPLVDACSIPTSMDSPTVDTAHLTVTSPSFTRVEA